MWQEEWLTYSNNDTIMIEDDSTEVSLAAELCDGLLLAEALVQIEPAVFTPAWYAGLVNNKKNNFENLTSVLNLLLQYYRHNLSDICVPEDLPVPELTPDNQTISTNNLIKFLKLMLGVSVTCSNKHTFINKIQSLDETAQHALTSCVASFIYSRDWTGRLSQLSSNTPDLKVTTPPGDEVWAQKCHELDFQVAMLKEERANLMAENEELYGKVRVAQSLSRKDSVKTREFERELAHIRDEFERLRLAYEGTKTQLEAMEVRMKSSSQGSQDDEVSLARLAEETAALRTELGHIREEYLDQSQSGGGQSRRGGGPGGDQDLALELSLHTQHIHEIKGILALQAGLAQEVECLKDQVDILREQSHSQRSYEQELTDIRSRLSELHSSNRLSNLEWEDLSKSNRRLSDATNELVRQGQSRTLLSLESESCLTLDRIDNMDMEVADTTADMEVADTADASAEHNFVEGEMEQLAKTTSEFEADAGGSNNVVEGDKNDTDDDIEKLEDPALDPQFMQQITKVENSVVQSSSQTSFQTSSQTSFQTSSSQSYSFTTTSTKHESVVSETTDTSLASPEVDSGLETTSENTPFASRPESELVLPDDRGEEDEVQATPRQLEKLLEESGASADSSPRDGSSPDRENSQDEEAVDQQEGAVEQQAVGDVDSPSDTSQQSSDTSLQTSDTSGQSSDTSAVSTSEDSTAIDTTSFNVKDEISKIEARLQSEEDDDVEAEEFVPKLTSEPIQESDVIEPEKAMQPLNVENEAQENATEAASELKADSLEHEMLPEQLATASEQLVTAGADTSEQLVITGTDASDQQTVDHDNDDYAVIGDIKSGDVEETHRSVEEIITEIHNPDLDSSLEDIQAMVEEAKSELSDRSDHAQSPAAGVTGTKAALAAAGGTAVIAAAAGAGMLSSAAAGYDPEDPKVKELEEWELKSHHDKSINLDDETYARILGLRSSKGKPQKMYKIEERRKLIDDTDGDDRIRHQTSLDCIGGWLINILIKIFD